MVYAPTGAYNAAVFTWMADALGEAAPRRLCAVAGSLAQKKSLQYGDKPHQSVAFYTKSSALWCGREWC